jgi:hypothetical protein
MTGPQWESAYILFAIIQQLLKLCGAIQNFDHHPAYYFAAH